MKIDENNLFIFSEVINCGKIGAIAINSFIKYHPNLKIHVYGLIEDKEWIIDHKNIVWHDLSYKKAKIGLIASIKNIFFSSRPKFSSEDFKRGHRGTARLWAELIQTRKEKYFIHFDSDVIFRKEAIDDITTSFSKGFDLVGMIRNYKNNPNNKKEVEQFADVTQTAFFGFNKDKIDKFPYQVLARMCEGKYNPLRHPVLDFFDPVMFNILKNGGKVYFLNSLDYGGCKISGLRETEYNILNKYIDFGKKFVHFSAVGSGMNFYSNMESISRVPQSYIQYAIERYALFSKIFYDENLPIKVDKKILLELSKIKSWY